MARRHKKKRFSLGNLLPPIMVFFSGVFLVVVFVANVDFDPHLQRISDAFSARDATHGIAVSNQVSASPTQSQDSQLNYEFTARVAVAIVHAAHYIKHSLDNEFSRIIFAEYLDALDPNHSYFVNDDVEHYRNHLLYFDDYLKDGDLSIPFEIYDTFRSRVIERTDFARSLLDYEFDFGLDEALDLEQTRSTWVKTASHYDQLWRKIVKNDLLNLKLSGTPEAEAIEMLDRRYARFQQNVMQSNYNDVFEIFINSYLKSIDPHTEYFSPHNSANLAINITQQLEGIGTMLNFENEYITVHSLVPGGPADRSGKIHAGDRFVAVSTNGDDVFVDIIGSRLTDVVDLIRGPKGSDVQIKVLSKNALPGSSPITVMLTRERIQLEDQAARKTTFEIPTDDGTNLLGVITLPTFYVDVDNNIFDRNERSSTNDVAKLLHELNAMNVDGVILDLRGNRGGALQEAVKMTGLFINHGPIIQVQSADGDQKILFDTDGNVTYTGPLVILVDRHSASASEIVAGTLKDYGRAVVVGETTYGKGVIQGMWPLSESAGSDDYGNLKLTTGQYFRLNGIGTQNIGITPDIQFASSTFDAGEEDQGFVFPEKRLDPVPNLHNRQSRFLGNRIPILRERYRNRVKVNPIFTFLNQMEQLNRDRADNPINSLNESTRKDLQTSFRDKQLRNINELRIALGMDTLDDLSADALPQEELGDAYLDESLNILVDLLSIGDPSSLHTGIVREPDTTS